MIIKPKLKKKKKKKANPITFQISCDNYKRYSIRDNTAHTSLCKNKLKNIENNSKEYWKINIITQFHTSTYHNAHNMLKHLNMQLPLYAYAYMHVLIWHMHAYLVEMHERI